MTTCNYNKIDYRINPQTVITKNLIIVDNTVISFLLNLFYFCIQVLCYHPPYESQVSVYQAEGQGSCRRSLVPICCIFHTHYIWPVSRAPRSSKKRVRIFLSHHLLPTSLRNLGSRYCFCLAT